MLKKHNSGNRIAKETGYSVTSVNRYIRKYNLQDKRNVHLNNRKDNLNFDYFKKIDTEEKAYILGFIVADGCIYHHKTSYDLTFTLAEKDKDILMKIKKELNSGSPIVLNKNNAISLTISSKNIYQDLKKLGVQERKTGKEHFPKNIREDLIKHFIRGFFDGDGSFVQDKNNYIYGGFFVCCMNESFLIDICNYFNKNFNLELKTYKPPSQTIYSIRTNSRKKCTIIYSHIYSNPKISLERKHKKINQFLKESPFSK